MNASFTQMKNQALFYSRLICVYLRLAALDAALEEDGSSGRLTLQTNGLLLFARQGPGLVQLFLDLERIRTLRPIEADSQRISFFQ